MSVSTVTVLPLTQAEIISAALRKLGVLSEGAAPSTDQVATARGALNLIVAEFRTLGMTTWSREEILLPIVEGQNVYTFGVGKEVDVAYPLYIYDITAEIYPNFTKISMNQESATDFNLLPSRATGTPVNYNYQPQIDTGVLRIWPIPKGVPVGSNIRVIYNRPYSVFTEATDNPDFPQEWGNALVYHLAMNLADEYNVPDNKFVRVQKLADIHLATALGTAGEQGSVFFQPSFYYGAR